MRKLTLLLALFALMAMAGQGSQDWVMPGGTEHTGPTIRRAAEAEPECLAETGLPTAREGSE